MDAHTHTPTTSSKRHPTSHRTCLRTFRFRVKKKKKEHESLHYTQALHFHQQHDSYSHTINKKPVEESNRLLSAIREHNPTGISLQKRYRTDVTSPFFPAFPFFYACHSLAFPPNNLWMAFLEDELHYRLHNVRLSVYRFSPPPSCPKKEGNRFTARSLNPSRNWIC